MSDTYLLKWCFDGTTERVPFQRETSLADLQRMVGGFIEAIRLPALEAAHVDAYADEEGKLKGEGWTIHAGATALHGHDVIVGNVALARHDRHGDTYGFTADECAELERWLKDAFAKAVKAFNMVAREKGYRVEHWVEAEGGEMRERLRIHPTLEGGAK